MSRPPEAGTHSHLPPDRRWRGPGTHIIPASDKRLKVVRWFKKIGHRASVFRISIRCSASARTSFGSFVSSARVRLDKLPERNRMQPRPGILPRSFVATMGRGVPTRPDSAGGNTAARLDNQIRAHYPIWLRTTVELSICFYVITSIH